ncbi:hypothetical protein [Microcoleus sp. FACHB-831]|nr:hypothetical protein [Microcoleus sp. FACHB-831]
MKIKTGECGKIVRSDRADLFTPNKEIYTVQSASHITLIQTQQRQ